MTRAEWVNAPTEIRSTPVSAIRRDRLQRHAARRLDGHAPPMSATASRSSPAAHIVEQHGVGAFRHDLAQLHQRVDLDLDLDEMTVEGSLAARSAGMTPPATAM